MKIPKDKTMTPTITTQHVQTCFCCPFGYHIDLDFVKFCDELALNSQSTESNPRRYRRKHRQSMEVMLGLQDSLPWINVITEVIPESDTDSLMRYHRNQEPDWVSQIENISHHEGFYNGASVEAVKQTPEFLEDVCFDFEKTLQRSKSKSRESKDEVEVVTNYISGNNESGRRVRNEFSFQRESDQVSETSNSSEVNPVALQQIREQMAISLTRMKELEEEVKLIPKLQNQLITLKEEKHLLQLKIKQSEECALSKSELLRTTTSEFFSPQRVSPVSLSSLNETISHIKKQKQCREIGTCTVTPLTRDVGVTPQIVRTENIGIDTEISVLPYERIYTKRELDLLLNQQTTQKIMNQVSVGIQISEVKPLLRQNETQTPQEIRKLVSSVGILAKPEIRDVGLHYAPQLCSIGVSDHTISLQTNTIGVGQDSWELPSISPISLKALDKSLSFSLNESEKLKCSTLTSQASTQHYPSTANKIVQNVPDINNQTTDTNGLVEQRHACTETDIKSTQCIDGFSNTEAPRTRHQGVNVREPPRRTSEIGSNTEKVVTKNIGCGNSIIEIRNISPERPKTLNLTKTVVERTDMPPSPKESRIPKFSPRSLRRFIRQDTYTVTGQLPQKSPLVARTTAVITNEDEIEIDSSEVEKFSKEPLLLEQTMKHTTQKEAEITPLQEKMEEHLQNKEFSQTHHQNEAFISDDEQDETTVNTAGKAHNQHNLSRISVTPSKEMAAALKVINDSLQKSSGTSINLRNANKIVQKEWFKVSSTETADPLDVEDYLDCFEEYSSDLFGYMVNLPDVNGNTAMHYAVSHGNFDVVSILLDSKVCHVNLTNNAGYTSVMLVSLAKLQTSEHRTVVQRLFQVSDVNIRAKKHNQTALMLAVSHGNLEMVKMLLEAGADINIQDDDGSTTLMCAAEHGRIDIVKLLLAHPDCDSTIQDIDGSTALKISLEAGYRDIGVLLYAHERIRNRSPYSSLRRKKERTVSGSSNAATGRPASARTSPLPSPKFVPKKEPFKT